MTSRLELEDIEGFYAIFSEQEANTLMAVGQINTSQEDVVAITVIVSTKIDIDDVGELIINYKEVIGSTALPLEELKEGGKKAIEEYKIRKEAYDTLISKVKEKRKSLELKLSGKGFPVVKGVFLP